MTNLIYFDGGCKPNPGEMEICVVFSNTNQIIHQKNLGMGTNNQAEWLALLVALEHCLQSGWKSVHIKGDSTLVVNQANGLWQVKNETIKGFHQEYLKLAKKFDSIKIEYIAREKNLAGKHLELNG